MKFDKNDHFIKHRSMNGVWYEQNGHKFSSGFAHIGKLAEEQSSTGAPVKEKKEIRQTAREKIEAARKKKGKAAGSGDLEGFKTPEVPGPMQSISKENAAAAAAEENAE